MQIRPFPIAGQSEQMGTCPEDFPSLGLQTDDICQFRLTQPEDSVPERQAVVVRNVHTQELAIGYIEGTTLHLATQIIRNYRNWGAETVGIVTEVYRRIDRPAEGTTDRRRWEDQ